MNLTSCGFSIWGSDLGGFLGWPEPAVYMRWTQFACFSPLMRCHGRTPREPWNYGDGAVANYKYYAWVRENLLDYIYNSALVAHETGVPMMRSMAVAYPAELPLAAVNDQYIFGRDMLVAPVVTEENSRTISFPAGKWTSLWTGMTLPGATNISCHVPLDTVQVYLREGAVVPVQLDQSLQFGKSMTGGRVSALIVTPPMDKPEAIQLNNGSSSVILQPRAKGLDITLTNLSETSYLLIYDAAATAVKADGKLLPKLAGGKFDSMPSGWQADPVQNRVVVRLPVSRAREVEIEVETQPDSMIK
jgi:alpha-glucosidase (family GH31 glycosyl hydrolase)